MKIKVYGKSIVGNGRLINEDQMYCQGHYRTNLNDHNDTYSFEGDVDDLRVFAIFDGIGGLTNGELASLLCVKQIDDDYKKHILKKKSFFSTESIIKMNRAIVRENTVSKMGSTAVIAECRENFLRISNIGDSRAYLNYDNTLVQLSVDHTLKERIKKLRNNYNIEIREKEYQKHILTQYIGVPEEEFLIEPFVSDYIIVDNGYKCLLCSDGLTDLVSYDILLEVINANNDCKYIVNKLMDMALSYNNTDNISIVMLCWCD